jgi:hypothetical protein
MKSPTAARRGTFSLTLRAISRLFTRAACVERKKREASRNLRRASHSRAPGPAHCPGKPGRPIRGASSLIGRQEEDPPSSTLDSDARPPVLVEVGDFDANVSRTIRGPSRPSGQKSCPCRHWPDVPTAPATGGPQPQQPNPAGSQVRPQTPQMPPPAGPSPPRRRGGTGWPQVARFCRPFAGRPPG